MQMRGLLIGILIGLIAIAGIIIVPVSANIEMFEWPNGDTTSLQDFTNIWYYYHHDTGKIETNYNNPNYVMRTLSMNDFFDSSGKVIDHMGDVGYYLNSSARFNVPPSGTLPTLNPFKNTIVKPSSQLSTGKLMNRMSALVPDLNSSYRYNISNSKTDRSEPIPYNPEHKTQVLPLPPSFFINGPATACGNCGSPFLLNETSTPSNFNIRIHMYNNLGNPDKISSNQEISRLIYPSFR